MSDLLNKASLVMVPSGYKEDTVYSVVPSDGSGDLAFTRASDGTRINSAGLVEVCPWNLVKYSEDFSNAYWGKDNLTITANSTTAPNGTTTADTLTRNAGTAYLYNGSFNLGVGEFTQSVYAKANASSSIRLEFVTGAFGRGAACIFDLSNGTAGTITIYGGVSGFTATIESVGNGWYRCSLGGTITIADTYYWEISITTGSIYVWGAQINIGSTAKPYFPTTDRLNVPRLTYQNSGGGCPSLLLEKQSTNLVTYSEQFDNAGWVKYQGGTITANSVTSPDGTQNADTLNVASGQTFSGIYQSVSGSSDVYTISIFAKYNTKRWMFIFDASSSGQGWFDLQNGVLGTIPSGHTGTIENFGNGWYRCTFKKNTAVTPAFFQIGLVDADGNSTPSSNGSSYIWGAQLEASSYATSYIPTTSSSATRVADACVKNGIGALIGGTSGTVFFDIKTNPVLSSANYKQFCYYFDSASAQSYMYLDGSNLLRTNANWGSLASSALQPNTRYKVALVYAPNDFALYVNGVSVATASSGTPKDNVNISIGQITGTENCEFVFNQYTHFKTRLTNAELASLTTL